MTGYSVSRWAYSDKTCKNYEIPIPNRDACSRYCLEMMHCELRDIATSPKPNDPKDVASPRNDWRKIDSSFNKPSSKAIGTCLLKKDMFRLGGIHKWRHANLTQNWHTFGYFMYTFLPRVTRVSTPSPFLHDVINEWSLKGRFMKVLFFPLRNWSSMACLTIDHI